MELKLKCSQCGEGELEIDHKTRRRVVYKCNKCSHEIPFKKRANTEPTKQNNPD